ncbi:hypothetical protein GCM10018779_27690 [Streptomyces griseocarneus]|nr:hypothetical protein GCM10018779_27690 [Streptomyces griseocarneus]
MLKEGATVRRELRLLCSYGFHTEHGDALKHGGHCRHRVTRLMASSRVKRDRLMFQQRVPAATRSRRAE